MIDYMIVPHIMLGLGNKYSAQILKKFEGSPHVEYGATLNVFPPKSLKNF